MSSRTEITILPGGSETYAGMFSDIRAAKHEIVYANFCFLPGRVFDQLSRLLIEAAQRGVKIHIIADWYGSSAVGERQVAKLRRAGVDWVWFRPSRSHWWSYNRRMHKKLLIVDRRVAYTGGVGVADFWQRAVKGYPKAWRDTHFRITESQTVKALYNGAASSWNRFSRDRPLEHLSVSRPRFPVTDSRPPRRHAPSPAGLQMVAALNQAKKSVRITTAYFGPSKLLRSALVQAAERGVAVELLLNGSHASHQVAWLAGQHYYGRFLKVGIRIYEYQPTKLHSKLMTIDGTTAIVGSANWNFRSLYHDQECNLTVNDAAFCRQLDRQFELDKRQSRPITEVNPTQRLRQRLSSIGRYFF